jgi:uncharacterized protein
MFAEWDEDKATTNLLKHKVSFEEAATVFEDYFALTFPDLEHSAGEDRFVTIGVSNETKTLVVINTQRLENIRIISARKATSAERKFYEQQF